VSLDTDMNVLANEVESAIANKGSRQQPRLAQNLEAVADADDDSAIGRKAFHRAHDWREARNSATAQVVAVGKSPRQHDGIKTRQRGLLMPDIVSVCTGDPVEGMNAILIAVRPGKLKDRKFHRYAQKFTDNGSGLYFEPVVLDDRI
jgi:hypothetical protein